ncbi:YgaP family membrane protein [Aneurinibacillus uraniidurans]|uniref:YgaP family membrane protein n=1 Tax=Aneurinibacillus uraniidurans TaxID=2966586 RepID=UPI00234A449E|nr:DUF2892 domain-containing protein [Aneurinibacillus sp. B1]WCN37920.1 DUF2892 domain-containing protein [Aneurinibacillus sp. B1]
MTHDELGVSKLQKNVGGIDRILRVILGVVLISLLFILHGGVKWIGLLGLVMFFTAFVGWCPLYKPFGINTCKRK